MRVKGENASWWEQRRGKRAVQQIDRYQCIVGDSDRPANGKKPKCPNCKRAKMKIILEVEQLGLLSSKFNLVARCTYPECGTLAVYNYEIDYDQSLEVDDNRTADIPF